MRAWVRTAVLLASLAVLAAPSESGSTCYGTTANGALKDGCKLPSSGPNHSAYTVLGGLLGRTWVHCTVAEVIEEAYAALHSSHPDRHFMTGETGHKWGGPLSHHKTHQNGLSVDFMVPVVDRSGASVPLPTGFTNRFGYDIEFDANGRYGDLSIDFDALAAHLAALRAATEKAGIGIRRVIFDPELQPRLRETGSWPALEGLQLSNRRAWVRHDEHYHVDFAIPCEPMEQRPQ